MKKRKWTFIISQVILERTYLHRHACELLTGKVYQGTNTALAPLLRMPLLVFIIRFN